MHLSFVFTLVAKRRLAFLIKQRRIGNNELLAPLTKWEAFKKQVEDIRDHAKSYEDAYNGIQASIERQSNLREVLEALPEAAKIQVDNERTRLIEARRIAISEKGAYVRVSLILSKSESLIVQKRHLFGI